MNNSQIKYPYIGQLKTTNTEINLLYYKPDYCIRMDDKRQKTTSNYNENAFKNITHEYLANTYGEVKSPEHAEFIIELAELHGFELARQSKHLGNFFSFDVKGFCFLDAELIASQHCKKITIPLPPKAPETLSPDEETELKSRAMASELNSQSNDDEWPQVGDEVCWSNGCYNGVVKARHWNDLWVMESDGEFSTLYIDDVSKPKTPEDLLIEELQTKLVKNKAVDNWMLAANIISGDIEGLTYTSKDGK